MMAVKERDLRGESACYPHKLCEINNKMMTSGSNLIGLFCVI